MKDASRSDDRGPLTLTRAEYVADTRRAFAAAQAGREVIVEATSTSGRVVLSPCVDVPADP